MDDAVEWSQICSCGKKFYQPNSYSNHLKFCNVYKKDLGASLEGARSRYHLKKSKQKKGKDPANSSWYGDDLEVDHGSSLGGDIDVEVGQASTSSIAQAHPQGITLEAPNFSTLDDDMPTGNDGQEALDAAQAEINVLGRRVSQPIRRYADYDLSSSVPVQIPGMALATIPSSPLGSGITSSPPSPVAEDQGTPDQRSHSCPEEQAQRLTILNPKSWERTPVNDFGLYKSYWTLERKPHDADLYISAEDLLDDTNEEGHVSDAQTLSNLGPSNPLYPFPNLSSFQLGEWYWSDESGKSRQSFGNLVAIITSDDFSTDDLRDTNWDRINDILASSHFDDMGGDSQWVPDGTSWHSVPVTISVPFNSTSLVPGPKAYTVNGFRYRPLVPIILERLQAATDREHFHMIPSDLRWQTNRDSQSERVYSELYHSPAFIEAYKEVQMLPPEEEDDFLPRCVIGLMFASDATAAASFGVTKIWPLYLLFGNESKYRCNRPSLKLFEEVAYFQSLPDEFSDWYTRLSGKKSVAPSLSTHVNRELFHEQWNTILDLEFIHAYRHGLVVDCFDKVKRRFYPRFLTYSADYPEKMTIVGVRHNGDHPCPRCTIHERDISALGSAEDRKIREDKLRIDDDDRRMKVAKARKHIYSGKFGAVDSETVEQLLKPTSLVPAQNAFSDKLSGFGLDVFTLPAVDPLHEVEIGIWRSLFVHLQRLLEVIDPGLRVTLDHRFRQIPTFGQDTIRRFRNNMSEMKQLAARDYEDMLQCAMPVFEGLFPGDHDSRVQRLLFILAHWHALLKMKLHTDATLKIMDSLTTALGIAAREFSAETCTTYKTVELKREYEARKRADARKSSSKKARAPVEGQITSSVIPGPSETTMNQEAPQCSSGNAAKDSAATDGMAHLNYWCGETTHGLEGRKPRSWNLSVPKFHALGDAVSYIRRFGTSDSYSTQMSERFHRFPKGRYPRTNKKNVTHQLSSIQTRQARIKKLRKQLNPGVYERVPASNLGQGETGLAGRYFIGNSQNNPVSIPDFLRKNANDPATRDWLLKLKSHLFPRIMERLLQEVHTQSGDHMDVSAVLERLSSSSTPPEDGLSGVHFNSERFYSHSILQIFYNTYDCRHGKDTLNPSTTRRDFMCLRSQEPDASGDSPKFVFGRLLGIFHVNVVYTGPGMLDYRKRRFDVLWVRWFTSSEPEETPEVTWSTSRLDRIRLAPLSHTDACGFLDPSYLLRGAHVIPRFAKGVIYTNQENAPGPHSKWARDRGDYKEYYVNRFVDRDMVMRFHWGLGVGHTYSHPSRPFEQDASPEMMDIDFSEASPPSIHSIRHSPHPGDPVNDSPYEKPESDEDWDANGSDTSETYLDLVQEPESSDDEAGRGP